MPMAADPDNHLSLAGVIRVRRSHFMWVAAAVIAAGCGGGGERDCGDAEIDGEIHFRRLHPTTAQGRSVAQRHQINEGFAYNDHNMILRTTKELLNNISDA